MCYTSFRKIFTFRVSILAEKLHDRYLKDKDIVVKKFDLSSFHESYSYLNAVQSSFSFHYLESYIIEARYAFFVLLNGHEIHDISL